MAVASGVGMAGRRSPPQGTARVVDVPARRHRVLVVEDEEAVAEGLRMLLEQEYRVEVASTGKAALELLLAGREPFDAVLCDLMMPGMSGIQLFEAVKSNRPGLEQRIVFMTGGAFTLEAEAFLDAVSNGRVEKPFDFATVDRLLRLVVGAPAAG